MWCAAALGCGGSTPAAAVAVPPPPVVERPSVDGFGSDAWGFVEAHGARLRVPLPSPEAWRVEEGSGETSARHGRTHSTLRARAVADAAWMDRPSCEARGEAEGFRAPPAAALVGDESVALEPGVASRLRLFVADDGRGELVGVALLIGARGRRCWFVRVDTRVPGGDDERLARRLAALRAHLGEVEVVEPGEGPPREGAPRRRAPREAPGPPRGGQSS